MLAPLLTVFTSGSFGIGTFLTNDFYSVSSGGKKKSKALNMVIKIADVNGQPCIKISDEIMKVSCPYLERVYRLYA